MRSPIAISLLLLIAAAPHHDRRQALMDEIERTIVLPKGAHPLGDYGRSYAFVGPDKVLAIYLVPFSSRDAKQGCAISDKDSDFRPCTRQEIKKANDFNAAIVASQVPAGTRRWLDDPHRLPRIFDGGCTQVTLKYDAPAKHFLYVGCNGYA